MMNPQYMPPGQNNNAPNNPLGYPPTSQEFNGVQNANVYSQMAPNGSQMPPKPFEQNDMSQKMQSMNINGQGFPNIPSSQLPPGQLPPGSNIPPNSNFGGQRPQGQFPPGRPPVSGAPEMLQPMQQKAPSSTPGPLPPPGFGQMLLPNQTNQFQGPPTSMPQGPMSQPSQQMGQAPQGQTPGQMPPHSQSLPSGPMGRQPGMPSQPKPGFQQPGMPLQPQGPQQTGLPPQMGMPPQSGRLGSSSQGLSQPDQMPPPRSEAGPGQTFPPQSGQPGLPQNSMPQPGMPSVSQPNIFSQPGFPMKQPGLPPQPGMPSQPGAQHPGLPQQPGMPQPGFPSQPGMPQQPGIQQPGLPPQPGMQQPGLAPQPGMQQPGMQQPGLPPQPGMQQPGLPPQPGMQQPGLPPQPGMQQPGLPPQPGMQQQGLPQQPGMQQPGLQPGMPPQPRMQQPGLQPGMPPQPRMQQPGLPPQPGMQQPGLQPGMPPQPGMQQPGFPPQPGMHQPGMPPQSGLPQQPGMQQAGLPPQPGMQQPGLPPQPGMQQPGLPPQPGMQFQQPQQMNQYQTMPGLPHMPPPLAQRQQFPNMPQQPQQQQQYQQGYQQPQSGYPPQPPFPGQQPSYPGQQFQQPPQKRLDPDNMPSPIQVMADDQQNRGGVFVTNEKGLVPPLVTTDFVVDDKGNASPRYIRSSMYSVPVTGDLLKQTSMPFCLVVCPMAETIGAEPEPPLLDFAALTNSQTMGPVRCSRCKAYMCPNMKFVDAGRHFKCAFCKATTEVPMEYTQYINSMQQYGRVPAEMALGAYEIVATKEYCRNNTLPNPPAVVFVIDVSYNSIKSGLLNTVCQNIEDFIEALPKDPQTGQTWTRVGFITYSSTVHFYNIKGSLAQPQMLSVGDVGDMFVPLLEGFLVRAEDSGPVLEHLLHQLPGIFQDNKETETILLPAVQAGLEALKAADTAGQLLVFHTSLPTYNAPGKLNNREDRKLLGTDKEKQILAPQTTAYNELGQACSSAGVCVELFVCNNSYVDAATIGQLPRLTGGHTHKYTYFTADTDGLRLSWDVRRVLSRPTAYDAVMRVRASTGVRATEFYGHLYMGNTTDVELAAVDADKAIGIEIKHDDKLTGEDGVYIQAALLYTHRSGQRRLRILNLALTVAHQLADAYRSMELDTCVNFLTKQAVWSLRETGGRAAREALSIRCAKSLAAYRRHCASPSAAGQLVLPESMKLLPLYTSCLLRSDALAGGPDITCDDRSCAMYRALSASVELSVAYTYPRLLPLHELPRSPRPLRASVDKMADNGVYLLENGVHMLLWVGSQASPDFVQSVFGVQSATQVDTQVTELPELDNETSAAVREIVEEARVLRRNAMRLTIMRQHDKLETVLRHFLVEDRGVDGSASYVDYLCHIHKEIRALL